MKDTLMICAPTKVHSRPWQHNGLQSVSAVTWMLFWLGSPRSWASSGGTTHCSLPDMLPSEQERVKLDMELMQM